MKHDDNKKILADMNSTEPIVSIHGGQHVKVPFAIEDGGRLGAHALSLLRALTTVAMEKGRRPPLAYSKAMAPLAPTLASLWVDDDTIACPHGSI
jgi:hypothetical protein